MLPTSPPTTTPPTTPTTVPTVGAIVFLQNFSVRLDSLVDLLDTGNNYVQPGYREVALEFTVADTGSTPVSEDIFNDLKIYDPHGQGYGGDLASEYTGGPSFPGGLITVAPGGTATGWVVVDVPLGDAISSVVFTPGADFLSASNPVATWTVNESTTPGVAATPTTAPCPPSPTARITSGTLTSMGSGSPTFWGGTIQGTITNPGPALGTAAVNIAVAFTPPAGGLMTSPQTWPVTTADGSVPPQGTANFSTVVEEESTSDPTVSISSLSWSYANPSLLNCNRLP